MSDVIRHMGHSYILATSPRIAMRTLTLKHDDTFGVFDRYGDVGTVGAGDQGVFHRGTRLLSHHEFRLGMQRPLLLSSTVHESNPLLAVDLTNPDIPTGDGRVLPRGTLHIFRGQFLWQGALYSRTRVHNYGDIALDTDLVFLYDADFADVFEVRGVSRAARGRGRAELAPRGAVLIYEGLDGIERRSHISFSRDPDDSGPNSARFTVRLPPQGSVELYHTIAFENGIPASDDVFNAACAALAAERLSDGAALVTANEQFNHWINRSSADLRMLTTQRREGPYPYAGVPWFSTVFGRDGIITAMQTLWLDPALARGVLATLAATQASHDQPDQDAEPGKILHESRDGEMAGLGEVPYARYYGSADSTPLFVMLAHDYWLRTGDDAFLKTLWPHIEAALTWIDRYGDSDGDGLVEYARKRPDGLVNQGWKDSEDSVSHHDGRLAGPPIALVEVQGYVYAARKGAAALARRLGRTEHAIHLEKQAEQIRALVEDRFWLEDMGTYALALDGAKRPCRVAASNAGHLLACGLPHPDRARRVAESLLTPSLFTGWGIRTLADTAQRYNPMSYHNGSVWPHDNALIAAGLARYGLTAQVEPVLTGLFDAALFVDLNRLPELFCGFSRQPGQGPTLYPVACIPQAWASASVFMLVQAVLGISVVAEPAQVLFHKPALPAFLPWVEIRGLRVGAASVDLQVLRQRGGNVTVTVPRRDGAVEVHVSM